MGFVCPLIPFIHFQALRPLWGQEETKTGEGSCGESYYLRGRKPEQAREPGGISCIQVNLKHCVEASRVLVHKLTFCEINVAMFQEPWIKGNQSLRNSVPTI